MMLFTRGMYELWLTCPGLIHDCWKCRNEYTQIVLMAHTRGVLHHLWLLQPCPRNLVDCRTRCTTPIETRKLVAIWALHAEHCVWSNRRQKFFAGRMHWAAQCRASLRPCCMCRSEIFIQWAKGSEIVLVPGAMFCAFGELVLLKLLVDRGKFLTHFS